MKHLFTLFLCLASALTMSAQSVSLFNVDASNFPTIKAKFFTFDAANKQQRPSKSELTITENGQPRTITSVTCPPDTVKSLSVCIMVDTYGYGLVKLAQAGTGKLINYLLPPKDEIAITVMDKGVQIHQDFTSDMMKAANSATTIPGAPGVDIQRMFYSPISGGVPFVSGRKSDKKVLVLISDLHCPKLNLDTTKLFQDAAKHNISVYSILLNTTDYSGLFKKVAEKSSGKVFEMVKTQAQVENIFQKIERIEHNIPCEITWEGGPSCIAGIDVAFSWQGLKSSDQYAIPISSIATISISPPFVFMGKRLPTSQNDTILTLTARNSDFTITDISRKFGSADFSIVNATFPISIPKNTNKTITLRFAPSDSVLKYASFEIESNKCNSTFSLYGGFSGKISTDATLKLTEPNGGERFIAGGDTSIRWDGIAPTDSVLLEYSFDYGKSWKLLATQASGLKYVWHNVPKPTSSICLVRVNLNSNSIADTTAILSLSGHTSFLSAVSFSPDGKRIATSSYDYSARIWDVKTGVLIQKLNGHSEWVMNIAYSPDGSRIATASEDKTAKLWDANTGVLILTLTGHSSTVLGIAFSPDASKIVTSSNDHTAKVWDAFTGKLIRTLTGHSEVVTSIAFSSDGSRIVTASADKSVKIWDANTGSLIRTISGHAAEVKGVAFSPDGSRIATSSYDQTAKVWDTFSGTLIHTLKGHSGSVMCITFSPNGRLIATGSGDNTANIWDASTGINLRTLNGHASGIIGIAFNTDGSKIATASYDLSAKIWEIGPTTLQADTSDAVFSIIAPEPTLQNLSIDMGKVLIGQSKDSTVLGIVCNKGSAPLHVLGIDITSGDSANFTIPRGAGDFFLDSNKRCQDVMFGFAPTNAGKWTAKATVRTTVGDFVDTITISGEGVAPALAIVNPFIDFGKTLVGTPKDSIKVVTIKNVSTFDLTITQTDYNAVNTTNFSTITGGNSFILKPNSIAIMDLRFLPNDVGRRSGILQFHYNGVGSPATVQLFGEGLRPSTTIIAQDITAEAGEKVNLTLKLLKSSGMQIVGAPTDWYARIHYNKSILFNEQTNNVCAGTTDSCVLELTGVYNPKTDELISLPCIATLGNTDYSSLVIEEFRWTNSGIATDVDTQNGTITITGTCEDGGVRLFIPAKNSTSLSTRPNPAQDNLQIQYGLREPLTVTLELLTLTGQVVQTIITNQTQVAGQYTLTSDLSLLGNGVYLLRMKTNKEMLTTRVDVVK